MIHVTYSGLATIEDLFRYKDDGLCLDSFPGYTEDQWGIKAHNRSWVAENGSYGKGDRVVEIGGAYSTLVQYLVDKHGVSGHIMDSFGEDSSEEQWSRWGDAHQWADQHSKVKYIFRDVEEDGDMSSSGVYDCVFTVSTLEHIPSAKRAGILRSIHRLVKPGGMELHTIDVPVASPKKVLRQALFDRFSFVRALRPGWSSPLWEWKEAFRLSGCEFRCDTPRAISLLDRRVLVESPDVVYRFYPPNGKAKPYRPSASLLLAIRNVVD